MTRHRSLIGLAFAAGLVGAGWSEPGAASAEPAGARLLADVFQDGAVLPHGRPVRIWGQAAPGEAVRATLGAASVESVAGADGRWSASLAAGEAAASALLTVTAGALRQSIDVAIGEVWLCAGQSNIEMPTRLAVDADHEVAAPADPDLHLLTIPRRTAAAPQAGLPAGARWRTADPTSVAEFSAACLFFGRELWAATKRPIGLIAASWGGSIARAWTSAPGLRSLGGLDDLLALQESADPVAGWPDVEARWWRRVDPGSRPETSWAAPGLDDRTWKPIGLPGSWKDAGVAELADFEGTLWLRGHLALTAEQAAQAKTLRLGGVAGADTTWVNGQAVGHGSGGGRERSYPLSPGLLQAGDNLVAIRVLDTGGAGGALGRPEQMRLAGADGVSIPLPRTWRFHRSADLDAMNPVPFAPSDGSKAPAGLFNGMIAPLAPYTLSGVVWYQGESDTRESFGYQRLLAGLMADWRAAFDQSLAFLVVQLPGHGPLDATPLRSRWAELREAQRRAVRADPQASLIPTIDLGDRFSLHPADKQAVGHRLAIAALRLLRGQPRRADGGAYPLAAVRKGRVIEVAYPQGEGLQVLGSAEVTGLQLCNAARCVYAEGRYTAGLLRIASPLGFHPQRVRYGWAESPIVNLFDGDGLPAIPFDIPVAPAPRTRPSPGEALK